MTNTAVFSSLIGFSKPMVFTAGSAMFLMIYLAMWKYNHSYNVLLLNSSSSSSTVASLADDLATLMETNITEDVLFCSSSSAASHHQQHNQIPVIYFVTPTYTRSVQIAELTRLGQTLSTVQSLHWILVEDSSKCNPVISDLLKRLGIPYTHLVSAMPAVYRKSTIQPRGVSNRRAALRWIRNNVQLGVLYFGDDDNTYDVRLFDEIRDTQHISMFPVGLVGDFAVSSPVVHNGKVIGFYDSWPAGRRYAVDMAGFAVNVKLLHRYPNATIIYKAGYEEDQFLQVLLADSSSLIEPKAANCTQILVWHTRTVQVPTVSLHPPSEDNVLDTSIPALLHTLDQLNLATVPKTGGKRSSIYHLNEVI